MLAKLGRGPCGSSPCTNAAFVVVIIIIIVVVIVIFGRKRGPAGDDTVCQERINQSSSFSILLIGAALHPALEHHLHLDIAQ
ncbi:MAG: hypothetical protein AAGJ35_06255 [Myxococcota bacterium]